MTYNQSAVQSEPCTPETSNPRKSERRSAGLKFKQEEFFSAADSKVRPDACVSFTSTRHFRDRRRGRARWTAQRTWAATFHLRKNFSSSSCDPAVRVRAPAGCTLRSASLAAVPHEPSHSACTVLGPHGGAAAPPKLRERPSPAATPSSPTGTDVPP